MRNSHPYNQGSNLGKVGNWIFIIFYTIPIFSLTLRAEKNAELKNPKKKNDKQGKGGLILQAEIFHVLESYLKVKSKVGMEGLLSNLSPWIPQVLLLSNFRAI